MVISQCINSGSSDLGSYLYSIWSTLRKEKRTSTSNPLIMVSYSADESRVEFRMRFTVTNIVRQGLKSCLLFILIYSLLCELSLPGVGYLLDISVMQTIIGLVAPCASALCSAVRSYTTSHGLLFSTGKAQLTLFCKTANKLPITL